jgi:ATP-dependent DNA helicase DinG
MIALRDSFGSDFVERTESFFSANGLLAKAKNFEHRPQQQQMAAAVARALEEERHLVVEAGTGVGKSLAYLRPAVQFALEQKKKAIISTHTINLQEQLLYKDIPILQKVLPETFEAALIKGGRIMFVRAGCCARASSKTISSPGQSRTSSKKFPLGGANARRDAERFVLSSQTRRFGAQVCSEAHICSKKSLWAKRSLLLSARPAKIRERADRSYQSHAAFHAPGAAWRRWNGKSGFLFPTIS